MECHIALPVYLRILYKVLERECRGGKSVVKSIGSRGSEIISKRATLSKNPKIAAMAKFRTMDHASTCVDVIPSTKA